MYLVTSEQMRSFDKHTIEGLQIPGIVLMDQAGKAVAKRAALRHPRRVVVLCGKGNNGGDGWVAARWLHHWGHSWVQVLSLVTPEQLQGDAAIAAAAAVASGVTYRVVHAGEDLPMADVVVDALLGTGTGRPLQGQLAELVTQVNAHPGFKIAVDVPTGVSASTGEVPGIAVQAEETVCMGMQKLGTAVSPGCYHSGQVHTVDIGIDLSYATGSELACWTQAQDLQSALAPRGPETHKGTFGRVGILVGSMQGAAVLSGLGAARSGAGLIVLATPTSQANRAGFPWEFVQRPVETADVKAVQTALSDCQSLVVGPGLGQDLSLARELLTNPAQKGVLDADGLRLLANLRPLGPQWVLTPHPKECADLLGWTPQEVQAHRLQAARSLVEKTQAVVVLKGYHSLVLGPGGEIAVNWTGDAALATAGAGDVLAGVIAGLMAQGADALTAAKAGTWLHGRAGEMAGQRQNVVSTVATDIVENISRAISSVIDSMS
ncbi:NAD(P)H-hydrate dehydratase [Alicyclobacillaceae bacterium I2511]|nr:NAD(P)H-hydrate dehydratase [Alicyclobacillaceae bacterium I2511]